MPDYDVVYFLNCKPVDQNGNEDKNRHWRSAAVHYGKANLDNLNDGVQIVNGQDEFAWLTEKCLREWEGWMYDVSFCERDKTANHFRFMIDERGSPFPVDSKAPKNPWRENEVCGWAAKVPKPENLHERSKMLPVYRADRGKLLRIHGYDCFREYYVTRADAPKVGNNHAERNKGQKITLFEKPGNTPPAQRAFRRRFTQDRGADEVDTGVVVIGSGNPHFVERQDMPADVEAPLNLEGGWENSTIDVESLPRLDDGDYPPAPDKNDDQYDGENETGRLYDDGEF